MADDNENKPQASDASSSQGEEEISEEERERRERVRKRRERLRRLKDRGELGGGGAAASSAAGDDGEDDEEEKERTAAEKVGKMARDRTGGSRKARMAKRRAAAKEQPVHAETDARTMTRRQAIRLSMWGLILMFFGINGLAFLNFFWPRNVGAFGGEIVLGSLEGLLAEIPVGGARRYEAGQVYLVRLSEDALIALWWTCPHLGCTVPWRSELTLFVCPCHGSTYTPDGQIIHGPAPRPMDKMDLRVEGDNLVVDTGNIMERRQHESEHELRLEL